MSDSLVVDASIALKWQVSEIWSDVASQLLADWVSQGVNIMAPSLLTSEIANALYKRVRRGEITIGDAVASMNDFLAFDIEYVPLPTLSVRALEVADQFGLKAVYDAHYLALAEPEGCELWTADERLWNTVKDRLAWVKWIGNVRPPQP